MHPLYKHKASSINQYLSTDNPAVNQRDSQIKKYTAVFTAVHISFFIVNEFVLKRYLKYFARQEKSIVFLLICLRIHIVIHQPAAVHFGYGKINSKILRLKIIGISGVIYKTSHYIFYCKSNFIVRTFLHLYIC